MSSRTIAYITPEAPKLQYITVLAEDQLPPIATLVRGYIKWLKHPNFDLGINDEPDRLGLLTNDAGTRLLRALGFDYGPCRGTVVLIARKAGAQVDMSEAHRQLLEVALQGTFKSRL